MTFQMNLMSHLTLGSRAAAQTRESGAGVLWEFFNDIRQFRTFEFAAGKRLIARPRLAGYIASSLEFMHS